jgi:modulator of FtsH protease HflK
MSQDHDHDHPSPPMPSGLAQPPGGAEDASSQALAEALSSSFIIVKILMILLVIFFLCSGMFTVGSQERALILRFGRPLGQGDKALLGPGFHWAFPAPIDEVVKIPAGQVRTAASTTGWYATTAEKELTKEEPPPGDSLDPSRDGYVLTSDANIVHVRATLRYRIVDPIQFEFGFDNAPGFITNTLNNAINFGASFFSVDAILTRDYTAFREKVRSRIEYLIDQQRLGIVVEQAEVRAINPRQKQVSEAFEGVSKAGLKSGQVLNEAQSYANTVRNRAVGEAASLTNAAQVDQTRTIQDIGAEAAKFASLLGQYQTNPALFTLIWQAEALQRVLTNSQTEKFYLAPGSDGRTRELRLLLSREPAKSVQPAPTPPADSH